MQSMTRQSAIDVIFRHLPGKATTSYAKSRGAPLQTSKPMLEEAVAEPLWGSVWLTVHAKCTPQHTVFLPRTPPPASAHRSCHVR